VPVQVERLAKAVFAFNAVLPQKLELLPVIENLERVNRQTTTRATQPRAIL
jgi:hypothetical protein